MSNPNENNQAPEDPNQLPQTPLPLGNPQWNESPFKLVEDMLPQQATNAIRTLYAVTGVSAVILGVALLVWPGRTLSIFAVVLGIYFVITGIAHIISSIVELGLPAGWRVLGCLIGVLLTMGGIIMLKNASLSGQALALVLTLTVGIGWILEGVISLSESWRTPQSGWAVAYAVLSILAGVVVLFFPLAATIWLIIFTGVMMIILGITAVIRAFTFGRGKGNGSNVAL